MQQQLVVEIVAGLVRAKFADQAVAKQVEVTDPIEESIGELSGVEEIRSTSAENVSSVFVLTAPTWSSVCWPSATRSPRG